MDRRFRLKIQALITLIFLYGSISLSEEILKLSLFQINSDFKIEQISSAGDYIFFKHLNKNLIEIDSNGRVYGDLAEKWKTSKNHTEFKLELKKNLYFSDHTPLLAIDVEKSFLDIKKKHGSIHFNFSNIKKIKAISEFEVLIQLKKSMPRFLRSLAHPEFGIRKIDSLLEKDINYKVTSGCYSLKDVTKDRLLLEKNNLCNDSLNGYKNVAFHFSKPADQKNSIQKNEYDFYISLMNQNDLKQSTLDGRYVAESPHIGFTYWMTINNKSKIFQKKINRDTLYSIFDKDLRLENLTNSTERAKQLYLPNGPGRLKSSEIEILLNKKADVKKTIFKENTVSILLPQFFEFNKDILSLLKKIFKTVESDYYNNQQEFIEKKYKKYDLFISNNDFSSLDLYENISVTFNPIRPLIYSNVKIDKFLKKLKSASEDEETFALYKKISESLITDSLIIPLVHKRILFLRKKEINISAWSNLYPEISAWKIKVNK